MDATTLTERCQDWHQELAIDAVNRLVKNVALTGGQSKNGYTYSESSLIDAVSLYADKPVFLDHASDRTRPQERSTRDLVGSIVNPRFHNHRIYGDLRVLDTESGQTFLKLLELETPGVGMSHVVRAKRSPDGKTVEEIADVISVDAVVNPATTSTFRESVSQPGTSLETLDPTIQKLEAQISILRAEHSLLQEQNRHLSHLTERLQRKSNIRELILQSRLPDQAVTDFFVQQLEAATDKQTQQQMIQDRLAIISSTGERRTLAHSQPRATPSNSAHLDDLFIQSLRRS